MAFDALSAGLLCGFVGMAPLEACRAGKWFASLYTPEGAALRADERALADDGFDASKPDWAPAPWVAPAGRAGRRAPSAERAAGTPEVLRGFEASLAGARPTQESAEVFAKVYGEYRRSPEGYLGVLRGQVDALRARKGAA